MRRGSRKPTRALLRATARRGHVFVDVGDWSAGARYRPPGDVRVRCVAKSAVSTFTDCLASEMAGSGVAVSLAVPAGLLTNLANENCVGEFAGPAERRAFANRVVVWSRGDPRRAAQHLLAAVLARQPHCDQPRRFHAAMVLSHLFPAVERWLRWLLGD